ncbi:hypothetical protein L2E82_30537 [Cichorium intybus]|uniref:Uncharacterized protein n=1 Tax=Cichorium intybus TaxID=13427 RepID=A0ACB9D139_CICIN|nr:hypothetical protein L2E82_30537 [Cichorium intybus]
MISDDHETDCKKKRNNEFVVAVVAGNKPLLPLQRLAAASSGYPGGRLLQPLAFNLLFSLLCIGLKHHQVSQGSYMLCLMVGTLIAANSTLVSGLRVFLERTRRDRSELVS